MFELKNVSLSYSNGDKRIDLINDVSFVIQDGAGVVVLGPSGSGKSSFLSLLAGFVSPTSGEVLFNGSPVPTRGSGAYSYRSETIGIVFQSFNLIATMSALENVAFAALIGGSERKAAFDEAERALVDVGLKDRMKHVPAKLSGGEQQRVAIARSLVNNPQVVLADEPTGNLDDENTEIIKELLLKINKMGKTVILVTHDPRLVDGFDVSISIKNGKLICA